jgi:hypothetical protein
MGFIPARILAAGGSLRPSFIAHSIMGQRYGQLEALLIQSADCPILVESDPLHNAISQ